MLYKHDISYHLPILPALASASAAMIIVRMFLMLVYCIVLYCIACQQLLTGDWHHSSVSVGDILEITVFPKCCLVKNFRLVAIPVSAIAQSYHPHHG